MDDISRERFSAAAEQMQREGFSDVEEERESFGLAESLTKLGESIRRLSIAITSSRDAKFPLYHGSTNLVPSPIYLGGHYRFL